MLKRLPFAILLTMRPDVANPFEDALSSLRVDGSVLLHGVHAPPWSVQVPAAHVLRDYLGLPKDIRIIPFHLVLRGSLSLTPDSQDTLSLRTGDMVICPDGVAHRMFDGDAGHTLSFRDVLREPPPHHGTHGTELLCGAFALRSAPLNPLLAALPDVLVVNTRDTDVSPLLGSIAMSLQLELARDERSSFATSRLIEILCAEAFRAHGRRDNPKHSGWFKALHDARISKALTAFHRDPGAAWTVASLARTVAMSASRFAARFREATGESVMSYVAAWRMNCACRDLQRNHRTLAEIAAGVGYQDVAAFSRAFKSLVGQSPAHWRRAQSRKRSSRPNHKRAAP